MRRVLIFLMVIMSGAVAVAEEYRAPLSMMELRRVPAPSPGQTGPRITIQITPQEEAPEPEPELAALAPADGPAGWFWSVVPAQMRAADRADLALRHLSQAPEATQLPLSRPEDLEAMVARHGRDILAATIGTEVSPALVLAVMAVESAGRADAVSGAGAQGLMQLIPATADRFNVTDPFDPVQNITGGVAYLDWLLAEFDRDPILALAGYNAGEGAVRSNGGVPDYAETRNYVPKVLATWALARSLCLTYPQAIEDGCVFRNL